MKEEQADKYKNNIYRIHTKNTEEYKENNKLLLYWIRGRGKGKGGREGKGKGKDKGEDAEVKGGLGEG